MSQPRRVLRAITRLNIGGPARQALLLTRRLRPEYDTRLVAGTAPSHEGELSDPQVEVVRAPLERALRPRSDARAVAAMVRHVRDHRPDLVHTHMAKAGAVGRLACVASRRRPLLVHTFHGHVLEGYFSPAVASSFVAAERVLARAADVLVAVSEEVRDDLLRLRIGTPEKFRVIRLGINLEAHRAVTEPSGELRRMIGLSSDVSLLVALGRLAPVKDLETMITAVARLGDVHLAVLGDGEERARLRAHAERLGVGGRVHFVGWWLDVPAALSDADLVVLSSRNEGTPVALIEAAACGRAVVATDVGGVRSVVADGEHGLLVPPEDAGAFADSVADLLADPDRRRAMGRAARAASSRFDEDRLVGDVRALYDELLS